MVKIAIEKHHQGKVFVKSKLNEGSTFSIWLPIDKNDVGAKKPQDYSVLDSFNYKTPQQLNEQNPQSTLNELSEAGQLNEYGAQGGQLQEKNYEEYKIEKIEDYSKKANFDAQFIGHNNEELQTIEQNKEIENNKENLFFEEFKKETIPSQNPINKANDLDNNQQKNVEFDNEIGKEIDKENGQETLLSQKTQQIQDEQGDWEISFEVRDN